MVSLFVKKSFFYDSPKQTSPSSETKWVIYKGVKKQTGYLLLGLPLHGATLFTPCARTH